MTPSISEKSSEKSEAKKVLIIDDEASIRKYLALALTEAHYVIAEAETGTSGLLLLEEWKPDAIILDLGLPDIPGKDVLDHVRKNSETPVIILTAHSSEEEKVNLLDAGADDYLTKPFGVNELLARLRVVFRRTRTSMNATDQQGFRTGRLHIDFLQHQVYVDEKPVRFTKTEYELLVCLADQAGRLVTQKHLLSTIWGPHSLDSTHYLRIYVTQIRKKIELDPANPKLLITEPGVGYRLNLIETAVRPAHE